MYLLSREGTHLTQPRPRARRRRSACRRSWRSATRSATPVSSPRRATSRSLLLSPPPPNRPRPALHPLTPPRFPPCVQIDDHKATMKFLLETETEEVDFELVRVRPNLARRDALVAAPARSNTPRVTPVRPSPPGAVALLTKAPPVSATAQPRRRRRLRRSSRRQSRRRRSARGATRAGSPRCKGC